MLKAHQILVRSIALAVCAASLGACGQKGALFLPDTPAARERATLPQTLGIPGTSESQGGAARKPAPPTAAAPSTPPAAAQ
ncbi:LPS translocon maturation chaperone LptM [Comamonas composti]|uniref:LPS translocon maturation chaperone LptM n=1 Tax=Comamonas composti TaxID=408558 RepID=UPI0003F9BDED|nr:lipoprotein [Comamonas composti]